MDGDVAAQKASLRGELLRRLTTQSPQECRRRSALIAERVIGSAAFSRAQVLLGYSALAHEVDTDAILDAALAQGKRVALPCVVPQTRALVAYAIRDRARDLEPGPYGVLQPRQQTAARVPLETIDLVLVPGVGFDTAGRRLGHGLGYYDRLLPQLPQDTPRIGLAFACQLVEQIPVTADDVPVHTVVSA